MKHIINIKKECFIALIKANVKVIGGTDVLPIMITPKKVYSFSEKDGFGFKYTERSIADITDDKVIESVFINFYKPDLVLKAINFMSNDFILEIETNAMNDAEIVVLRDKKTKIRLSASSKNNDSYKRNSKVLAIDELKNLQKKNSFICDKKDLKDLISLNKIEVNINDCIGATRKSTGKNTILIQNGCFTNGVCDLKFSDDVKDNTPYYIDFDSLSMLDQKDYEISFYDENTSFVNYYNFITMRSGDDIIVIPLLDEEQFKNDYKVSIEDEEEEKDLSLGFDDALDGFDTYDL